MPLIKIESPQDPRVAPYMQLHNKQLCVRRGRFIAESELVVERLLQSRFAVESLLVAETQLDRVDAPPSLPIYCAPLKTIEAIAGFHFHRGILGNLCNQDNLLYFHNDGFWSIASNQRLFPRMDGHYDVSNDHYNGCLVLERALCSIHGIAY